MSLNVDMQFYSVFDLNGQVESTTGVTGITGKSKTKHPRVPRGPRGLLFLNTQVKNALSCGLLRRSGNEPGQLTAKQSLHGHEQNDDRLQHENQILRHFDSEDVDEQPAAIEPPDQQGGERDAGGMIAPEQRHRDAGEAVAYA